MARMRTIKPEYWADRKLASAVSRDARLLYIGLWNLADEHARLRGDGRYLQGHVFPYDDDLEAADVDRWVGDLAGGGWVVRYEVDDEVYLHLPKLAKHQRLETEKVPSRHPAPPAQIGTDLFARDADECEPGADEDAPEADLASGLHTQFRTDKSAPGADELSLKHVAGSREHVAGSMVVASAPTRDDVERICNRLADRIEENGSKRPRIGKTWREDARLLLDHDGRTETQVLAAIDWCQADPFWRGVVMSMTKLREKYDQMRLAALRVDAASKTNHQQATDGLFDRAAERMGVAL